MVQIRLTLLSDVDLENYRQIRFWTDFQAKNGHFEANSPKNFHVVMKSVNLTFWVSEPCQLFDMVLTMSLLSQHIDNLTGKEMTMTTRPRCHQVTINYNILININRPHIFGVTQQVVMNNNLPPFH
jgi:hypothetical protein